MSHESMATLSVSGNNEDGLKTTVNVRDLDGFIVDEPERLGGTNAGANPLEYFLGALSACTSIVLRYAARDEAFEYTGVDFIRKEHSTHADLLAKLTYKPISNYRRRILHFSL